MDATKNQQFHLILADIAMAMAIGTLDAGYRGEGDGYRPGAIRDGWLAQAADKALTRRVTALANAGLASLSLLPAQALLDQATRFGVPMDAALARKIADHFTNKREAVLVYNR